MASTQHRSIRIPDDVWLPAMEVARQRGTSAGELCREFLEWYLRMPKAELPRRPPVAGPDLESYVPIAEALWTLLPNYKIREMLGLSEHHWGEVGRRVLARGKVGPERVEDPLF